MATMVFLPGASGHGSFWDPVRSALRDHDTLALDWPGLGDVAADPAVNSYEDLVHLVIARIEAIDVPAVVVGQSMGGWVAARVAVLRPELVSHLVLCVTSAGVDMVALGAVDWRPGARRSRPDAPEWSFAEHPPMESELARLDRPTLLLWASDDAISPADVGRRLDDLLPDSQLVVYDSDDHWVVLHNAADVARRIDGFVR